MDATCDSLTEPRTINLHAMRSKSCGGSEYFLFPGGSDGEDNVFVKILNPPKINHKTANTFKTSDLPSRSKAVIKAKSSSVKTTNNQTAGAVDYQMRPRKISLSGSFECDQRRSQSAGSIYGHKHRRREMLSRGGISNQPSPVASYINQVDSGRGSRTSFMSVDSTEGDSIQQPSNDSLDNVTVVVRIRPFVDSETRRGDDNVTQCLGGGSILIDNGCSKPFTFNAVFDGETSQSEFFDNCGVMRLVDKALEGFACTVFAYGPTGSGKTHTITGPAGCFEQGRADQFGLIQRSFMYLFNQINNSQSDIDICYYLKVSYLEVYNEKVKDLLNPAGPDSLKIRWTKNKGFHVENLFTVECETIEDIMIILEEGINHRQMGVSNSNEHSSRSHCLLLCEVMSECLSPEDNTMYIHKNGHLTFVDLAGSEKLNQTASEGNLTETTNINKSLLALGNCISCLSDTRKRSGHIPYRESKLTQLLADSLGGNGITLMVACVSPSSSNMTESLNTLRYANRAKKIKNKPFVLMDPREKEIVSLRREVGALRSENEYLRSQIDLPKEQTITQLALKSARLKMSGEDGGSEGENNSLYEMVQAYMIENEKLRRDTAELTHSRDKVTHQLQDLAQENVRLVKKLEQFEAVFLVMQNNNSNNNNALSPGGSKIHPTTQRSNQQTHSITGSTVLSHGSLTRPAMAAQLNTDQQTMRRNAGLPPVMSNRGVPNGFTSPRANPQGARSPDRKSTQTNPSQQSTGSRNSLQANTNQASNRHQQQQPRTQPVTVRGSNSTNQNGERNSDSEIFSDDENDARRLQNRNNNRMNNSNSGGSNSIQSFNRNGRPPPQTNTSLHSTNQKTSQQSSVFAQKTSTPKVNVAQKPGSSFSNSDTSELAQINEKLLKDIQSLDSEIEFYTQRVKKPRK